MGNIPSNQNKAVILGVSPADKTYTTNKNSNLPKNYTHVQALVVGIGYDKTPYKLSGTRNDANQVISFLKNRFGSKLTLTHLHDAPNASTTELPTRQNVLKAFETICKSTKPNTLIVCYFSGHGSQVRDLDGDEDDGKDETLCLIDEHGNIQNIVDDTLSQTFYNMLPASCELLVIFDCCHSGSSIDLKYTLGARSFASNSKYHETTIPVYYIGGTIDSLCSYERNGRGYLTQCLLNILNRQRNLTFQALFIYLRAELAKLISPSLQSVTIAAGQNTSPIEIFPL